MRRKMRNFINFHLQVSKITLELYPKKLYLELKKKCVNQIRLPEGNVANAGGNQN